jgi:hypothetical protein
MRKKGKFKTYHRKNEEKGEFETLGESLMFLRGYFKYALTQWLNLMAKHDD